MDFPHNVSKLEIEHVQPYGDHYHQVFEWNGERLADSEDGPVSQILILG